MIYYPLTASQNMLHRSLKEFRTAQVLTIGVCITLQAPIDFNLLDRCICEEIRRQQCLELRFTPPDRDGNIKQYFVPNHRFQIPYLDLSSMEGEAVRRRMTDWSAEGFEEPDSPLFRFIMVSVPNGHNGVYLCVDHRIIDSCGLISMMNDLFGLYCHYQYSTLKPVMPHPYREMLQKDLKSETDRKQKERDIRFWKDMLSEGEPVYTDVTGSWKLKSSRRSLNLPGLRSAERTVTPMDGDMRRFSLAQEKTKQLSRYCKIHSISMTNLMLMGIRTCLSGRNGNEPDISIRNYVSRRTNRAYRTCGGCRIHCYPCRTVIAPSSTFLDGCRLLQRRQNDIYRHCDLDPQTVGALMADTYSQPPGTTYEGVAFTCQPVLLSPSNPLLKRIPLHIDWFSSGADIQKCYLTVMQNPEDGGLDFYFKYQTAELEHDDIRQLYDDLIRILMAGTEQEHVTIDLLLHKPGQH